MALGQQWPYLTSCFILLMTVRFFKTNYYCVLLLDQIETKAPADTWMDMIVIKVLCECLSSVVRSLLWWESFRRWITWCIFNFPAVALVQDSVGHMEMSARQASDISRRGLQHLRHDVRRSLPEAGQEGVQVILATKEKQQRRQKVSGQFRKCPISSDFPQEYTQGPWWVNAPSRQQGIITHPHLCSLFLYSIWLMHMACSLSLSLSELHHK